MPTSNTRAATLPELLLVLVLGAIFASAVTPRLQRYVARIQQRAALDRIVTEIYHARMLAVEGGAQVAVVLGSGPTGCIEGIRVVFGTGDSGRQPRRVPLDVGASCLRHNGDSAIIFNGRGMLRPPTRSIFAVDGPSPDSAVLSIAGRIRRSY